MVPIPEIRVEGTHYDVGHAIGLEFKDMIEGFVTEDKALNEEFLPFIETGRGRELYEGYLSTAVRYYPQYLEELHGMADATGIPFQKFFLLAIRSEISSFNSIGSNYTEGCTDVYLRRNTQFVLGHTEDGGQSHCNRVFIVHAVIRTTSSSQILERFTAVTLAGFSPGNTFGVLPDAGLFYTINVLFPKNVQPRKIPRPILNRALLAARDFDHLLEIVHCLDVGSASGCSINVGVYSGTRELWTVEVAPVNDEPLSLVKIKQFATNSSENHYYQHYNRYKLMEISEIAGGYVESTDYRQKRILELPPPVDDLGIREILGDEEHNIHRIHNKNMPTGVATLFTVIVDLVKGQIQLFAENPKLSEPSNVLQLVVGGSYVHLDAFESKGHQEGD